jgi:hypothetical protein
MGRRVGTVLVLLVAFSVFVPGVGHAIECNKKEQFFIRGLHDDGSTALRKGTWSTILMRNRDLDPDCPGPGTPNSGGIPLGTAFTVSTAHVRPGVSTFSDAGKWVEIGWLEVWEGLDTSSQAQGKKQWYVFASKAVDYESTDFTPQLAPNLEPGNEDMWRIQTTNDDSGWKLSVNFILGLGWVEFKTYTTNWSRGVPLAEAERKGTGTGLADEQRLLQWKRPGDDQWVNWEKQDCYQHIDNLSDPFWLWDKIAAAHFKIVQQGGVFC